MQQVYILCGPFGFSGFGQQAIDFSRLIKWLSLFLEYDFKSFYKVSKSHLMVDALSRLPNQTKPI
jgi:hypothetical protein